MKLEPRIILKLFSTFSGCEPQYSHKPEFCTKEKSVDQGCQAQI